MPKALFILTSHDTLGDTGKPTGFYWEELAAPYWILSDAGWQVELASIAGGKAPADPSSEEGDAVTDDVRRLLADEAVMNKLAHTQRIEDVEVSGCDIVYLPGGHYSKGPDWEPFAIVDGRLVTGQNPASSAQVARLMLETANLPALR